MSEMQSRKASFLNTKSVNGVSLVCASTKLIHGKSL